jgi:hypothetical protein
MSSAERHLNSFPPKAEQAIETIYTTVESQPDQTDWLTVVSNLRQINRQLVEQIARLEHALASSQQSLETHKEEKQSYEITILQQQDELKITHERVGALFQQLETSHQIGQRQQILVETLSQQLEIAHAIIAQLETENSEVCQQSEQQAEKLTQTEQVAIELHRQLKQQASIETPTPAKSLPEATTTSKSNATIPATPRMSIVPTPTLSDAEIAAIVENSLDLEVNEVNPPLPDPQITNETNSGTERNITQSSIVSLNPPDEVVVPAWTPKPSNNRREEVVKTTPSKGTKPSWNSGISLPKSTSQIGWREDIANSTSSSSSYKPNAEPIVNPTPSATPTPPPPAEIANKESTAAEIDGTPAKPSPNWPAPTVTKSQPTVAGKGIVDVPKFPKK